MCFSQKTQLSQNFAKFRENPRKKSIFLKIRVPFRLVNKELWENTIFQFVLNIIHRFQNLLYKSWDRKEWTRKEFGNSLTLVYKCQNPCGVNLLHIFCRQKKIRTQKSSLFWRYLRKKSSPGIRVTDKERVKCPVILFLRISQFF